jgi:hypothetical protein
MVMPSCTIAIGVQCPFDVAYEFLANTGTWPLWAKGLGDGFHQTPEGWEVNTPHGMWTLKPSPRNTYGVLDHWVSNAEGREFYNPMRVVANGDGCDVAFTLFRHEGMDDAQFEDDARQIKEDLHTLKGLLEKAALS